MKKQQNKKRAAVLATDGFEQSEFESPIEALKKERSKDGKGKTGEMNLKLTNP